MNQLATMLDTDLTVDPRARSARSADEAESGVDFGQVLQGLSKPEDASVDSAGFGHVRRHAKKGVGDGLAITTSESIVPTSPLEGAKGAPLTPIDIGSVLAKVDPRATPSASGETRLRRELLEALARLRGLGCHAVSSFAVRTPVVRRLRPMQPRWSTRPSSRGPRAVAAWRVSPWRAVPVAQAPVWC